MTSSNKAEWPLQLADIGIFVVVIFIVVVIRYHRPLQSKIQPGQERLEGDFLAGQQINRVRKGSRIRERFDHFL